MSKIAMVAGAVMALGLVSGANAADRKLVDAGALENNTAAVAAAKAESLSAPSAGANTQLSSNEDVSALGNANTTSVGSHAYAATPDAGAMKQGVLNAKVELSALPADPQIHGGKHDGAADVVSQGNPLAPAK